MHKHLITLTILLSSIPASAQGQDTLWGDETWRLDGGLTFSRFEQQVKSEIGGATGERLVSETNFGLALHATYRVWGPFALGLYAQYDIGSRTAGRFSGLDANNKAVVVGEVGGSYHEFWLGPLLRVQWKSVFAEVAWAPLGLRFDDARDDLPSKDGNTDTALLTSFAVSWYVAIGGSFEVMEHLDVVMRMEYRVRYYNRRSDGALANEMVHGTQNITPFLGVAWVP
jgi:hypothetical protein